MHLLAAINNNIDEWRALQCFDQNKPRLPLPYAFGAGFVNEGHSLSAIDLCSLADKHDIFPFQAMYHKGELSKALKSVDVGILWGTDALMAIMKQALNPLAIKNILYFSYVFNPEKPSNKQRFMDLSIRALTGTAKGLILMTAEQVRKAKKKLGTSIPIIRLSCGIDTAYYQQPSLMSDIPENYKQAVEKLLNQPYVIMPGDELRFNDDAIHFVEKSGIRLVRVSQYGFKSGTSKLKQDIIERNLVDRLLVFEKISYPFLRFLLQHASAYAGLVDSSWQPAGWTVACEALSSGLPMVLYEGLVSREMFEIGAPSQLIRSVSIGDVPAFTEKLCSLVESYHQDNIKPLAISFASQKLDFIKTAPVFVRQVEDLMAKHV